MLNRGAGPGGAERRAGIEAAFAAVGIRAVIQEIDAARLKDVLREAVETGGRVVAVGGGDGTISTAADVLQGTATALLPVPLGTRNHFALRHGIDSIETAARALQQGSTTVVPIGLVNGRAFVNNASCGFYAHVVRRRDRLRRWVSKWPASVIAAVWVLIRRPLLDVELYLEDRVTERRTVALWVGIGRNSLRLPRSGDAETGGNVLEIVLPRTTGRLSLLAAAIRVYANLRTFGRADDPVNEVVRAREFVLRSRRVIDIALDGEDVRLGRLLHFEYRANALRVVCPDPVETT